MSKNIIPITLVLQKDFAVWVKCLSIAQQQWLTATAFENKPAQFCLLPMADGQLHSVCCIVKDRQDFWSVGNLPFSIPQGCYQFDFNHWLTAPDEATIERFSLAFILGSYQFTRYCQPARQPAQLATVSTPIKHNAAALYLVRDLINTPTEDMGPTELAEVVQALAEEFHAEFNEIVGDALLQHKFNAIHAVGRASDDAPRLLDLRWGNAQHPRVTLVGKGVCFDTGGLNIKTGSYMNLMKKDMGGAAHVLGLACMVMRANLPVRLRVLIPAVENAVSGNAFRPGDVITMYSGKTVEVGNTDGEGRLVLADAISLAIEEKPDLLLDIATLTGAARVAVGTEMAALFCNNNEVANVLLAVSETEDDPMCRLPLYKPYRDAMKSAIADINNDASDGYAGAIRAALFLQDFVPAELNWLHFDLMAWNVRARPGRPVGGEAMGVRALFAYLQQRYQ